MSNIYKLKYCNVHLQNKILLFFFFLSSFGSLYQVFVLPVEEIMVFDCSFPGRPEPISKNKLSGGYITAQILVRHVGTEVNFTVGDGIHYGGFYNAPLENGRNYYIILRAVSQWNTVGEMFSVQH